MLNEFIVLERGLAAAGFSVVPRHPDVQSPGKNEALHVRLDARSVPVESAAFTRERVSALWTLRDGKHNSFPFMQIKRPLLSVPNERDWHSAWSNKWKQLTSLGDRRRELCSLARDFPIVDADWDGWPGPGLKSSLARRITTFSKAGNETRVVTALIERFLQAATTPASFIRNLAQRLLEDLTEADADFLAIASIALAGKVVGPTDLCGAPLYFDLARYEFADDITSPTQVGRISTALTVSGTTRNDGLCDLTGKASSLHDGNFPQPSLPVLGQVYLFAKNGEIPAAHRYGRADDRAINVDAHLVQRLAGALDAITAESRKGKTWRSVPSERPKKSDLLLAFVDQVPDARVAGLLADSEDEEATAPALEQAAFLKRTERVLQAVKAKVTEDFRRTPVTYCILRKVDTGNAKVVLYRSNTVGELYDAAISWAQAQGNLPSWLTLPPAKSTNSKLDPNIAPLQIPRLSQTMFIRDGSNRAKKEPMGITAQDAFSLFLNEGGSQHIARVMLRLLLRRQGELLSGTAQARRKDASKAKLDDMLKFDRVAALDCAAMFGISLAKVGRHKEVYMNEAAFKLGQLLAVADVVHVGYCIDMRGGSVPPTLLGNSILPIAQTDPVRALSLLCRRWKPYGAWSRKPALWSKGEGMKNGEEPAQKSRGWALLAAIRQARQMDELARELHGLLPSPADDQFRAELLLGYLAGMPGKSKGDTTLTKEGMESE